MLLATITKCLRIAPRASGALALALATLMCGIPYAIGGIANTRHNLSSTGNVNNVRATAGTDEICVFCHTPHAAVAAAPAPLWNKSVPAAGGYTTYATLNSTTIDGTFTTVGSVSLACLSCHDGTQAMDNIINAPGSGGYNATGGGALGLSYTWSSGSVLGRVDIDGKMTNAATTLTMLGTDLSNDHPIGIQYCGGGPTSTAPATACKGAIDFKAPSNATINGNVVWWVDTAVGVANTREKSDIMLYSRAFGAATSPSVECASCHDPHVEGGIGNAGATFLRVSNTGSGVCLSCHIK